MKRADATQIRLADILRRKEQLDGEALAASILRSLRPEHLAYFFERGEIRFEVFFFGTLSRTPFTVIIPGGIKEDEYGKIGNSRENLILKGFYNEFDLREMLPHILAA